MELLIILLIIVIIIGALLGAKSLGGTIRKGCGFLLVIVIAIGVFFYFQLDSKETPENQEGISTSETSVSFTVKDSCPTFIKPNIESDVSGNLEIGEEILVEAADKFSYFYEITDENGLKVFVRKVCLEIINGPKIK